MIVVASMVVAAVRAVRGPGDANRAVMADLSYFCAVALFVLINGAMVMGLAPVVGVPMPLLSYGGTVMLTVMIGFGLVMATRVHRYAELPKGHGLI